MPPGQQLVQHEGTRPGELARRRRVASPGLHLTKRVGAEVGQVDALPHGRGEGAPGVALGPDVQLEQVGRGLPQQALAGPRLGQTHVPHLLAHGGPIHRGVQGLTGGKTA